MPKKSPPKASVFIDHATFDAASAVAAIEDELPSDVTIDTNVWSPTWNLVHKLFRDHDPFWVEHCDVEQLIQEKVGNKAYTRIEDVGSEMWYRLVRTAYVVGWVAAGRARLNQLPQTRAEGLSIDTIDHACDAAANAAAVLQALAESKATGDTHDHERLLWFGLRDLATRMLDSLEQIRQGDTAVWNYIHAIEEAAGKDGGAR